MIKNITKLEQVKIGDILGWKNGLGEDETGEVVSIRPGSSLYLKVKIHNTYYPVQYMLNIHTVLTLVKRNEY